MKSLFAVLFAAGYGLTLRILFGFLSDYLEIMSIGLLMLAPVILGFITVALIARKKEINGTSAFFLPWLTILVLIFFTMLLSIEGIICWIMIYPLASVLASVGGVIAYRYNVGRPKKKEFNNPDVLDNDELGTLKTSLVLLLPLFIGMLEGEHASISKEISIKREIIIPASSKKVWEELMNIDEVSPKNKSTPLASFLGFPKHLRTTLDKAAVGGKRVAYYENGLYFEEEIIKYRPEKLLVLGFNIDPSKIPPLVMDEHIVIGGKHVDILQDTYTMKKLSDQSTHLTLTSHFIIRTPINWYTGIWAEYLMSDILQGELDLIKKRATLSL